MGRDMARSINQLNALAVSRATERGYYPDGAGLYLQVSTAGTKSWIFRYCVAGRTHDMGLGSLNDFTLAEARARAKECRQQRARGIDPVEARRAVATRQRLEEASNVLFKRAAERYLAAHEGEWKNKRHRDQWHSTLETYVYPIAGAVSVGAFDTPLMLAVLEQPYGESTLWATRTETASRVRARIESILDAAKARGERAGENPARWKGHLDQLLSTRRSKAHYPALPFPEIPAFMRDLRSRPGPATRALELTILTALRSNEALRARRSEFDLAAKVWVIPPERMKGRRQGDREHRVPLSARAIEIVSSLPVDGDFIFPGECEGRPLTDMAMVRALRRINAERTAGGLPRYVDPLQNGRDVVPHGFRSSFDDWAHERTNFQNHVIEMALSHAIEDEVEAAYRRGDLFEKRRRLMDAWAAYCCGGLGKSQVVPLRPALAG
jgi:integrase